LPRTTASAIGLSTRTLQENRSRLSLAEAMAAYQAGKFTPGTSPVLNFGIGAKPVWIHFRGGQPGRDAGAAKRLSIETAWLDRIELYIRHQGKTSRRIASATGRSFMHSARSQAAISCLTMRSGRARARCSSAWKRPTRWSFRSTC
jgi:hypothetical protein